MVIRRAKYGDLRNYINKFFSELTWADRIEILINISKALKHIHEMNLIHRDFHCKNVLVDENRSILICDFGLCTPVDLEIASDKIQGVLPYIAPEVLKKKPYTKKSEVYSLSMIMWELTSNESPFSDRPHDKYLAIQIVKGQRPDITKETPNFYAKIMEQCWDPDPSKRPDSSDLPELFK
ncbi:kinase-like domain-containing protein, partial [Rhizophagus diaphanus]